MSITTRPIRTRRSPPKRQQTRLLVATAGEPESQGALCFAAELAARERAAVVALGVARPFPHGVAGALSLKPPVMIDEESRLDLLDRVRRTTESIEGSTKWEKRALVGIPDDAINDAARTWRATLIILGIGRHSRVDRVFGSETAVAVARKAAIPIVAVPSRVRSLPKRALAALDFTPASMAAAVRAASLLAADGELVVAHVGAFEGVKPRAGDLVDIYRAGAETKLRHAVHALSRRTKRQISSVMLGGEPADALVAYARKARCDLIALGGHDQPLLDRVLLGSVRTRVLRSAHCSVLISPPEGVL